VVRWRRFAVILCSVWVAGSDAQASVRQCVREKLIELEAPGGIRARVPIYLLPEDTRSFGDLHPARVFDNFNDELVIGITEPRHYFAWVGGKRFDGDIIKMPMVSGIPEKTGRLLLVRFPDLPPEAITKARSVMNRHMESVTLTCVHSSCRILHESGIRIADGKDPPVWLAEGLERILEHGFNDKYGRPMRAEVFFSSSSSTLEQLYSELKRTDAVLTRMTERRFAGKKPEDITSTLPVDYTVRRAIAVLASPEGGIRKGAVGSVLIWVLLPDESPTE